MYLFSQHNSLIVLRSTYFSQLMLAKSAIKAYLSLIYDEIMLFCCICPSQCACQIDRYVSV